MTQPEPLHSRLRKAISDSYYEARNAGLTMEDAATDAASRCEAVVSAWLAEWSEAEAAAR